eukprot:3123976-Prymnesium_polylepis.2
MAARHEHEGMAEPVVISGVSIHAHVVVGVWAPRSHACSQRACVETPRCARVGGWFLGLSGGRGAGNKAQGLDCLAICGMDPVVCVG